MTTPIEPALSAEEWRDVLHPQIERGFPDEADSPQEVADGLHWRSEAECAHRRYARGIALANAALPDDSPYRITRADVGALRALFDELQGVWPGWPVNGPDQTVYRLADKLAALLPPE